MGQLRDLYYAKFVDLVNEKDPRFREVRDVVLNENGLLAIYESERKFPGKIFLKFIISENGFWNGFCVKSSCGDITAHTKDTIEIQTFSGSLYRFEIIENLARY